MQVSCLLSFLFILATEVQLRAAIAPQEVYMAIVVFVYHMDNHPKQAYNQSLF